MSKAKLTKAQEERLRELLNAFFQDIDVEARIKTNIANAVVDIHLRIFKQHLASELAREREEVLGEVEEEAMEGFHDNEVKCNKLNNKEWNALLEGWCLAKTKLFAHISKLKTNHE